MRLRARSTQDLVAGLLFLTIALAGLWISRDYAMGTPARMGKGYMPWLLCVGLALAGAATIARALLVRKVEPLSIAWRPLLLIVGGFALFGLLIDRLGFVLAAACMLLVGVFAVPGKKTLGVVITVGALIALCALIFVGGLGLPIPVWPRL